MRGTFVFCSLECRDACKGWHASRAETLRARNPRPEVTCASCGTTISRPPSAVAGERSFCCPECFRRWQRDTTSKVAVACSYPGCSIVVERWPSEIDAARLYCSLEHKHAHSNAWNPRSAGEIRACAHCGKERWRWRCEHYIRFCSRSCWGRYRWRKGLDGVPRMLSGGPRAMRRWKGRWGGVNKGGRPSGSLSFWNREALPGIRAARDAFEREHGRNPSLRELAAVTSVPRSTLARLLSQ